MKEKVFLDGVEVKDYLDYHELDGWVEVVLDPNLPLMRHFKKGAAGNWTRKHGKVTVEKPFQTQDPKVVVPFKHDFKK